MRRTDATRSQLDAEILLAILDSLPHLVTLWDREQRCVFANAASAAAFGRRVASMRGCSNVSLLGPHAVQLQERNIAAALDGETSEIERVLFDGAGGLRHFQVHYTPNELDGVVVGYSTMSVDVTALLYTQAELARDSEWVARLDQRQRVMAIAGQVVLEDLSSAQARLSRVRMSSQDPSTPLATVIDTLADSIARLRVGAEATGDVVMPEQRVQQSPYVVADWSPDEEPRDPPADGAAPRSAAGRLADQFDEVAALLDSLPVVVTEWDPGLHLRFANRAAAAFFKQWGDDPLLGRHVSEIADKEFLRANQEYIEDALRGETQSFYRKHRRPDGTSSHFHVRYVPRLVGGEVVGGFAFATDITLRIEAADALTAARAEHAGLRERQAIVDELHGAILQELFGATLAVAAAGRARGEAQNSQLEAARASIQHAIDTLSAVLATP